MMLRDGWQMYDDIAIGAAMTIHVACCILYISSFKSASNFW